jgi:putative glycosyltransferase (TIGR04372 family)
MSGTDGIERMAILKKFRIRIQSVIQIIGFAVFGFLISKKWKIPSLHYLHLVKGAGIFPRGDFDTIKMDKAWHDSDLLWNQGAYAESTRIRKELLEDAYTKNGVLVDGYAPPILSKSWATQIGHLGCLGVFIEAQNRGIIPSFKRTILIDGSFARNELFQQYSDYLNVMKYGDVSSRGEFPSDWHVTERLAMIRTNDSFICLYEMYEQIFKNQEMTRDSAIFKLPAIYSDLAKQKLVTLGLPKNAPFVTLHIRNTGKRPGRRNQPIESYLPAILEIIAQGYYVVRIGDVSMSPFPAVKNFIDLTQEQNAAQELHLYSLAMCEFFIGTTSGPIAVPSLYGVPTLTTNCTSIGRNTLSLAKGSLYLPKKVVNQGKDPLSLHQIIGTSLGFDELDLNELNKLGFGLIPNSSDEILYSVKEMLIYIQQGEHDYWEEGNRKVQEIRDTVPFSSQGTFSQTFLAQNCDWFLN